MTAETLAQPAKMSEKVNRTLFTLRLEYGTARMGNNSRYKLGDLESINDALQAMPPADPREKKVSKTEAISALLPGIKALDEKGYSLAAVVEILKEHGVETSETSLAKLLKSRSRKGQVSKSTRRPQSHDSPRAGRAIEGEGVKPNSKTIDAPNPALKGPARKPNAAAKTQAEIQQKMPSKPGDSTERAGGFTPRPDSNEI
jgi:hypothetical protein